MKVISKDTLLLEIATKMFNLWRIMIIQENNDYQQLRTQLIDLMDFEVNHMFWDFDNNTINIVPIDQSIDIKIIPFK